MPLDQTPNSWQPSVCPHDCPSTCALDVEVLDERRIGKVRGAKANAYTDGVICAKVARYAERIHHPERLLYPLRRTSEKGASQPEFKRISWEEALDQTAEALLKAEQRYGSETVWPYFYAGTMGHVQRDGIERLRHVKRYSRQWSTICTTLAESGWFAGVGRKVGVDAREVAESELIVVWGGNPVSTQVNLMNWIAKARKARGAKLVVIDPYRTPTAEQADLHLMVQPGSDAALAAAVAHVLIEEKLIDRDYLARLTDWSPEIEAHYMTTTPDWAAPITGLSEEAIRSFACLYGSTKKSYIRVGYGFARARHGAASVHAVSCLPSLTGAWTVKGGGALWGNGWIYRLNKTLIDGADSLDPSVRVLDQSRFGPVMTGDKRDLGEGPPITALLIQNTNPAVVCPETTKCIQGLMRPDLFTVVHEQFLTDTAQLADIVLPATMFLEHDDYYTASGHTHLQVARKLVEAPGECRSNHDVICQLAKRLGASHPGFDMTAWEIVEATFKVSGYASPDEALRKRGLDCAEPFEKAHFLEGFPQPDGRFHFRADWARIGKDVAGLSPLPGLTDLSDRAAADRPFRLVAAPARSYLNSTFTETPGSQKREGRPELLIHPSALARLGLAEGQLARIGNELGSLVLHLRPFDGVQENVVVVESIWPNSAFVEGRGINTLVSAEAGKPRGGAVFHDTAIWVRAA